MDFTSAAFAAIVTVYFWWQNLKGIEESSDKALEVMKITTVMVVILLTWGIYSAFHVGAKLPPLAHAVQRCTSARMRSAF